MASTSSQSASSGWPPEPIPPVGYLSRKALPIKKEDAQPLSRDDVQYDLLDCIFSNDQKVFTSQARGKPPTKVSFGDLYVDALYNSSKCSKVLKDKMVDTPAFAIELAKISLLTNVGRINTTMAFFPEMKTALRTYHPVPSLQKTDGNAQDAPRIKNCLKAALLPSEFKSVPPSTPAEILQKSRSGQIPPTSVVNLIFVLANHANPLASVHFDFSMNFYDLFLPKNLSSPDRARAFLWLVYHYLEGPTSPNPFHDDHSRNNPGKVPLIRRLTDAELQKGNIDTPEEIEWGKKMSNQRNSFLQKLVSSVESDKRARNAPPPILQVIASEVDYRRPRRQQQQQQQEQEQPKQEEAQAQQQQQQERRQQQKQRQRVKEGQRDGQPFLHYVPSTRESAQPAAGDSQVLHRNRSSNAPCQERTMLEHAWHTVMTTDPLMDSDEEETDEHARLDYTRRLAVINRLQGLSPEGQAHESQHSFAGWLQEVDSWE